MNKNNRVRLNQILVLLKVLREGNLLTIENIEKKYLLSEINFGEPVNFLKNLKIIREKNSKYYFNQQYEYIKNLNKAEITSLLINLLLEINNYYFKDLYNYFENFKFVNGRFEFSSSTDERLRYSQIRNFLIELGILFYEGKNKYIISKIYNNLFFDSKYYSKTSQEEFDKYLLSRKNIGLEAELFVLKYEKEKLESFPNLINRIEHTSINDVSAGYDIKSFFEKESGQHCEMYIEVKAVSPFDWVFNWSRNEIEKANIFKDKYFLYLLPVGDKGNFQKESIRIIQNPYANVFKNKNWHSNYELMSFTPTKLFTDEN